MRPKLEVADIFRRHGDGFRAAQGNRLSLDQRKVMAAIEACRTPALGGHVERCEDCGETRISYNSCRDRHCPKCQGLSRLQWLADRRAELLPVAYFHVVFTVPAPVAAIALQNKALVYDILFKAAAETIRVIGADPKHLGAETGMVAILHTWGQTLTHHPHVHCIVPGGGLAPDGSWIASKPNFFLPVHVLSRCFRRLFLERLRTAFDAGRIAFLGELAATERSVRFRRISRTALENPLDRLRQTSFCRPLADPRLSRPLHASRRHRQRPSSRLPRWPRQLSVEGLSRPKQVQGDDVGRRRVHAPLSHACLAQGLPPHSPLRLSRQRLPRREARPHPRRAGLSRTRAARRARGLPRTLRTAHRQAHRHLPFLRRPNGRRRLMAASLPATANPTLRHLMTPNPRTLLLRRIHINVRPVHRRSPANLRLRRSPTSVSPNEPEQNRRQVAQLGDRHPPNLTVERQSRRPRQP